MMAAQDLSLFVRRPADGVAAMDLVVDGVYCGACIVTIEKGLRRQAGVRGARVNLASRRVTVEWNDGALDPPVILERLEALGYPAYPFAADKAVSVETQAEKRLLRCLGVAAFGAMNVMLLSVSLWAGADSDPNSTTRDLFHWLSALVALPCAAYAGLPFFESAARALRAQSVNMDVPISLGVILALGMSVLQTLAHERVAYFDSALMLVMFLLAGRYLDQRMRRRTRDFAVNLSAIRADRAVKLIDGEARETPIAAIGPGDLVLVRAGERIAVDGTVENGRSEIDQSLVTGETAPVEIGPGAMVYAGTVNLSGALRIRVQNAASGTLLDEVNGLLMKAIEQRSSYVQLADRAARLYVPLVHAAALATFIGWLFVGAGWQQAMLVAITVLIITCPCALGLAVPAVQAVAAGALFRHGLILNSGEALERLAEADTVVFDKTGTLTQPKPSLANAADIAPDDLALAGSLALASRHPLAKAIAEAAGANAPFVGAQESPGQGVSAGRGGERLMLGSVAWCEAEAAAAPVAARWPDASLIALKTPERAVVFAVRQALRPDAREVVADVARGREVEILSGDREQAVALVAREVGVARYEAALKPAGKIARLEALAAEGKRTLMVGDGLNDAPALAAAHVSISPISAAHIAQAQADALFLGERLAPVADALKLAAKARRLMVENLWLSAVYNMIAVPLAILGFVTPLIAALAMSGSSILVTLNALRARRAGGRR
jgi:Cu2+-exporting ATPase